jgi:prepilin-type processing-associated H-X9-DG protein
MKLHPALIELVVSDMATTLAFYRRLGMDIPETADAEPHVDVELPGGMRLAWDTEDTIRSFDPGWSPPTGGGHRANLAFADGRPVDLFAPLPSA